MTKSAWLTIGYTNNLIDLEPFEEILFLDAFRKWFSMKIHSIKSQSCDRIEVTFNRYYSGSPFIEKCISTITEQDIVDFLSCRILENHMGLKEFGRLYQIMHGVLCYMKDLGLGGAVLYDWDRIKRYLPSLSGGAEKQEYAVPKSDVEKIMYGVICQNIYPEKRNACLCLCMNFYLGLRIGELAGLTFNDFDFDRNILRVCKTECKFYDRLEDGSKNGAMQYQVVDCLKTVHSFREIPLMKEVRFFYEEIKKCHEFHNNDSPYLASDGTGSILVRSLDRTLRRLCRLCDVHYFNSHMIRKTFVTMLHYSGVPTRVISDIVGHAEVSTTEHNYILSYADNYRDILEYMNAALDFTVKK